MNHYGFSHIARNSSIMLKRSVRQLIPNNLGIHCSGGHQNQHFSLKDTGK